jgi:protein pelota
MQILKFDRKEGKMQLVLQTLEDLWHLHKTLEEGDFVRGKTYRKVAIKRGHEIHEGEKKPVNLTIKLEKSEFHKYTGKLRLSGMIHEGPEDIQLHSHHTLQIEPGMHVMIKKKKWKPFQVDRLKKAKVKETNLFFLAIDREKADFAGLKEYGLDLLGSISFSKKLKERGEETGREEFYKEIIKRLENTEEYGKIIICGPGFERENITNHISKINPALRKRILLEHSSSTGKPGIQEVIKSSGNKILKETRIARETGFIEKLLLEIKKEELAVYKEEGVSKAIEYGALETLLISDTKVREYEKIIEQAEGISARIIIISSEHEAGEQLLALGGIAGFLRYKI